MSRCLRRSFLRRGCLRLHCQQADTSTSPRHRLATYALRRAAASGSRFARFEIVDWLEPEGWNSSSLFPREAEHSYGAAECNACRRYQIAADWSVFAPPSGTSKRAAVDSTSLGDRALFARAFSYVVSGRYVAVDLKQKQAMASFRQPPTSGLLLLVLLLATVARLAVTGSSKSARVSEQRAARATILTAFETTVSRRVQSSGSSVFRSHSLGAARRSAQHGRDGCQPNAKQRILHRGLPRRLDTVVALRERANGLNRVCPVSFHSFNIAEHVGRAWMTA